MLATNPVLNQGLALFNNSLGFIGVGGNLAGLNSATNNADLNPLLRGMSVAGNGVVLSSTVAQMFTAGSKTLSSAVAKGNVTGQLLLLASDLGDLVDGLVKGEPLTNTQIQTLASDINGLVASGLLSAIATAELTGATTVVVAGATLSLPVALSIAAVAGATAVALGYASNLQGDSSSISQATLDAFKGASSIFTNLVAINNSSDIALPDLVVIASSLPDSKTISADGRTVTKTYGSALDSFVETQTYTDSTRASLALSKTVETDSSSGLSTTTTINYNPADPNGSCTVTTETTSADGKTLIQKVDSNADGVVDSVTTTTTTSNGSQIVQVDSTNSGVIDQTYVLQNGRRYNVANLQDAMQIDALMYRNQMGDITGALSQQIARTISESLIRPSVGSVTVSSPSDPNLPSTDPIGAFYDSQSTSYDQAASIASHTGVLVDSQDWAFYTQGNSQMAVAPSSAPTMVVVIADAPQDQASTWRLAA